ncbi:MAG: nitroreductase family protein [Elusimicrobiota bacterium]|jgi:nitroreductase|nr:nitroreductase family protein [Elusimicrobiota bacterium]
MDILLDRQSVRKYTEGSVKEEDLDYILRSAMSAPSANNRRPWYFLIIRDKDNLKKTAGIHSSAQMILEAPLAILVLGDEDKSYQGYLPQDLSAATENILLAAAAKGYGAVWCGIYSNKEREEKFSQFFNLPKNIKAFSLIVIGKPAEEAKPKDRFDPEKIKYEAWK